MNNPFFRFDPKLQQTAAAVMLETAMFFDEVERTAAYNAQKVLHSFIEYQVSESHFAATTGYGYDDRGRDTLDQVFAEIMGAQDALVRHSFLSGTHTLAVALFGVLRPGDTVLSVTGQPYDTLQALMGNQAHGGGSLADFGIRYREVSLNAQGKPDLTAIASAVDPQVRMVYIQRSRGYSLRQSLSCAQIGEIVQTVKAIHPGVAVLVDNCYGEFVEKQEPTEVGADLIVGSLIKNPGGGIAPAGGYIAGRADLVALCAQRYSCPGVGREVGASLGHNRELYMGLYHAPKVVGEALKTAIFAAALFERLGFETLPRFDEPRADIIQAIRLLDDKRLITFCQGIQSGSPVDAFAAAEPAPMPGYDADIIMAAGAFTLGSSIELSADAPLREPYAVFLQGGINFDTAGIAVMLAAQRLQENNLLPVIRGNLFTNQYFYDEDL